MTIPALNRVLGSDIVFACRNAADRTSCSAARRSRRHMPPTTALATPSQSCCVDGLPSQGRLPRSAQEMDGRGRCLAQMQALSLAGGHFGGPWQNNRCKTKVAQKLKIPCFWPKMGGNNVQLWLVRYRSPHPRARPVAARHHSPAAGGICVSSPLPRTCGLAAHSAAHPSAEAAAPSTEAAAAGPAEGQH